jgi:hypothetical protein
MWECVSQYIAQLGEAGFVEALCIRLFSLSLTGTAFAWFSSLPAHSIYDGSCLSENSMSTSMVALVKLS